jgi:hypothetical protein
VLVCLSHKANSDISLPRFIPSHTALVLPGKHCRPTSIPHGSKRETYSAEEKIERKKTTRKGSKEKLLVRASKQISMLLFTRIANGGLGIQESSQEGLVVRKNVK